jgi:hypothetical protein
MHVIAIIASYFVQITCYYMLVFLHEMYYMHIIYIARLLHAPLEGCATMIIVLLSYLKMDYDITGIVLLIAMILWL